MLCKCHWIVLYTVHFTAFCSEGAFFRTLCITVYRPTVAAAVIFVDRFLRWPETTKHFTTVQTAQDYSLLWKWKKTFTSGEKTMLCLSFKLFYSTQNNPLLALFAGTEPPCDTHARLSNTDFFLFANAIFSLNTFVLITVHCTVTTLPWCFIKRSMSFLQGSPRPSDSIHFLKYDVTRDDCAFSHLV